MIAAGTNPVVRTLEVILRWAAACDDIRGIALVGSWAIGKARSDSDIDLVLLAVNPEHFRTDPSWIRAIDWASVGADHLEWRDEDYGNVWSRRIWLGSRLELEVTFAPLSWASTEPLDAGTLRVISDGCQILYDPGGILERLCKAVNDTTRSPSCVARRPYLPS
jgi:hypothetical protein